MSLVVLSPHLDDAIMSVGGTMHLLARLSMSMRIVTLFAGDPRFAGAASWWDAERGTRTAAEAFEARRAEDIAAAAVLGLETVWLPFNDDSYAEKRDPDAIWSALEPHLSDATAVIVPGGPLAHPDHAYTTTLVVERLSPSTPLFFYSEQPYAWRPRYLPDTLFGRTPAQLHHLIDGDLVWTTIDLDSTAREAKNAAMNRYEGELSRLGYRRHWDALVAAVLRRERIARRPGEPEPAFLAGAR
jgi:LmbE family N-acetylglucosaminyl deacetylase